MPTRGSKQELAAAEARATETRAEAKAEARAVAAFLKLAQLPAIEPLPGSSSRRR